MLLEAQIDSYSDTLCQAVEENDFHKAEFCLKRGANPNAKDKKWGTPALMVATRRDNPRISKLLLINYNADINIRNRHGETPLMCAVAQKSNVVLDLLLEEGADVNAKNKNNETALMYAVDKALAFNSVRDRIPALQKLLEKGADVNARNANGKTALMIACENNLHPDAEEAIDLLLRFGADPNGKDEEGYTPLSRVLANHKKSIAKRLIECGADVNICFPEDNGGETILAFIAQNNYTDLLQLVLKQNIDVNARNKDGQTALMLAAAGNAPEAAKLLLEKGADADIKDKNGMTPLMIAILHDNMSVAEVFSEYKLDVNAQDSQGNTALIYAARTKNAKALHFLLEKGADMSVRNYEGQTAMDVLTAKHPVYQCISVMREYQEKSNNASNPFLSKSIQNQRS